MNRCASEGFIDSEKCLTGLRQIQSVTPGAHGVNTGLAQGRLIPALFIHITDLLVLNWQIVPQASFQRNGEGAFALWINKNVRLA